MSANARELEEGARRAKRSGRRKFLKLKAERSSMLPPPLPYLFQVCQGAACGERNLAQILANMENHRVMLYIAWWTVGSRSPA